MAPLDETVRSLLAFAASYRPGAIIEAERVVDAFLSGHLALPTYEAWPLHLFVLT